MKTIDLCVPHPYSPLIPAVKAICEADEGEQLEIILGDATAFNDLKEYRTWQSGTSASARFTTESRCACSS